MKDSLEFQTDSLQFLAFPWTALEVYTAAAAQISKAGAPCTWCHFERHSDSAMTHLVRYENTFLWLTTLKNCPKLLKSQFFLVFQNFPSLEYYCLGWVRNFFAKSTLFLAAGGLAFATMRGWKWPPPTGEILLPIWSLFAIEGHTNMLVTQRFY